MPIIVIDPGHGGENRGGEYGEFVEKEINPIVAQAMKEHLEKFEDVTVFLTHEVDMDMTIKARVAYAKEKNADFLYCLHFNLSVNHNLYGGFRPVENYTARDLLLQRLKCRSLLTWDYFRVASRPD